MGWIVFLVLIAIVVLYGIMIYNNLVALQHNVSKSWSNIDVLLKQRHVEHAAIGRQRGLVSRRG